MTSRTSTSESRTVGARMPETLRITPPAFHGRGRDSATLRLADIWDVGARQASDRIENAFRWAADIVGYLMAAGEHDRLARLMAPLDAACTAWERTRTLDGAARDEAHADAAEDVAQSDYYLQPTRETARALTKASAVARLHSERRDAALIQEHDL